MMEEKDNANSNLEPLILSTLAKENEISDTYTFSQKTGIDHQMLVGVVKSLLVDRYVVDEPLSTTYWTLTEEGKEVLLRGSAEVQVYNAVPPEGSEGLTLAELNERVGSSEVVKIGLGVCMKNKWLKKAGDKIVRAASSIKDETSSLLTMINEGLGQESIPEEELKNLKKRKLVQQITRKSYRVNKGPDFKEKRVRKVADLHKSMLGEKNEVNIVVYDFWSILLKLSLFLSFFLSFFLSLSLSLSKIL
jgi:phenylalanyl-tRNA synthetase alpha chain